MIYDDLERERASWPWLDRQQRKRRKVMAERETVGGGSEPMRSVLQDWVMRLPLREQGTLLTVIRGCDLAPKFPLDSIERELTAAFRGHVGVPADPREVDSEPGCFMSLKIPLGSNGPLCSTTQVIGLCT